jgi:hypothetical protein
MCHHVHVTLSPEERAYARRLTGYMVPVYAAVVLVIIAVAAVTGGPRSGELVASASAPVASR